MFSKIRHVITIAYPYIALICVGKIHGNDCTVVAHSVLKQGDMLSCVVNSSSCQQSCNVFTVRFHSDDVMSHFGSKQTVDADIRPEVDDADVWVGAQDFEEFFDDDWFPSSVVDELTRDVNVSVGRVHAHGRVGCDRHAEAVVLLIGVVGVDR